MIMACMSTNLVLLLLAYLFQLYFAFEIKKNKDELLCASGKLDFYKYEEDLNPKHVSFLIKTSLRDSILLSQNLNTSLLVKHSYRENSTQLFNSNNKYVTSNGPPIFNLLRIIVDIRDLCFTGDFMLAMKNCSESDVQIPILKINAQRNLLKKISEKYKNKTNLIQISKTSVGKLKLEKLDFLKVLNEFNCPDIKVKIWISSNGYQKEIVSEKLEISMKDLHETKELNISEQAQCKSFKSYDKLTLNVLGKFLDEATDREYDDESRLTQMFELGGELPPVEPMFAWDDSTHELWLKDEQVDSLKGCFTEAFFQGVKLSGTKAGFRIESKLYCRYKSFQIVLQNNSLVHSYHPKFNLKYLGNITLEILNLSFRQCAFLDLEIECIDKKAKVPETFNERFRSDNGFIIPAEKFMNKRCRVKGYSDQYIEISPPEEIGYLLPMGIVTALLLTLILIGVLLFIYRDKVQNMQFKFTSSLQDLHKKKEKVTDISSAVRLKMDDIVNLNKEFEKLNIISSEEIEPKQTFNLATSPEVVKNQRNRYKNILPFDSNVVMLDTPKGEVPLPYVNASDIKFNGFKQTYLAVQAPKVKAMPSFWQMVLERKVRIIVMITGLVENKRIKADRYWPEEEDAFIVFEDIKITFLDQSYNGSFFTRHLELEVSGEKRTLIMFQSNVWPDMTAPDDSSVLIDLVLATQHQMEIEKSVCPILVHCSAGVGRTGTFIAVHKLYNDILKNQIPDVYETVLTMRRQRTTMVQKVEQYVYIYQCLLDISTSEESEYIN